MLHKCYLLLPACKKNKLTPFKKFSSSKRELLLTGTSWDFSDISSDIFSPWAHESNSLDVNKVKHARNSRKVEEDTLRGVRSSCNVQK